MNQMRGVKWLYEYPRKGGFYVYELYLPTDEICILNLLIWKELKTNKIKLFRNTVWKNDYFLKTRYIADEPKCNQKHVPICEEVIRSRVSNANPLYYLIISYKCTFPQKTGIDIRNYDQYSNPGVFEVPGWRSYRLKRSCVVTSLNINFLQWNIIYGIPTVVPLQLTSWSGVAIDQLCFICAGDILAIYLRMYYSIFGYPISTQTRPKYTHDNYTTADMYAYYYALSLRIWGVTPLHIHSHDAVCHGLGNLLCRVCHSNFTNPLFRGFTETVV